MTAPKQPPAHARVRNLELRDVAERAKKRERIESEYPDEATLKREFGRGYRKFPDGSYKVRIDGQHGMRRYGQMSAKAIAMETAESLERAARTPMVQGVDSHGMRSWVVADKADREFRRGRLKYIKSFGRRRAIVERGPDGMLFRLVRDAWEPVGRTAMHFMAPEAEGIQVDPDGYPWRKIRGEWRRLT